MSSKRGVFFTLKGKAAPALKAGRRHPCKAKKQDLKAQAYRYPQLWAKVVAPASVGSAFVVLGQAVVLTLPAFGEAARWLHAAFA